jgi:hypothetical protein
VSARAGALIVGTMGLSLEDHREGRVGVDAHEDADRVELVVWLTGAGEQRLALTRYEAEKLASYLRVACARGPGSK